jgi:superoxide dismutase, Fe-Mn family
VAEYVLPDLPYDYGALEPHISGQIMELHHDKHHQAYVTGHVNHSVFWPNMSPDGGDKPDGELAAAIDEYFGSFDGFRAHSTAAALGIQGSGWAILAWDSLGQGLIVEQLYDHQGNLVVGSVPLLMLDMWEHAFYLQYRNLKADYVKA